MEELTKKRFVQSEVRRRAEGSGSTAIGAPGGASMATGHGGAESSGEELGRGIGRCEGGGGRGEKGARATNQGVVAGGGRNDDGSELRSARPSSSRRRKEMRERRARGKIRPGKVWSIRTNSRSVRTGLDYPDIFPDYPARTSSKEIKFRLSRFWFRKWLEPLLQIILKEIFSSHRLNC